MLNHQAAEFYPSHFQYDDSSLNGYVYTDEFAYISIQDLEEIEACDEWVNLTAHLDELEQDHLIAFALKHAPPEKLQDIRERVMKGGKGKRSKRAHSDQKKVTAGK
ncbi:hypothetical protein CEUSTIGMA_g3449.t1 [Chlamydomonas eustigma]|uniref:Uncharacterized protein n=1 Tax=Chlamydomonas eustigma TaxID=1157962 RepID=A0A250WYZ7_9CHLO|nr:hypothetical protein CEUSTIGMA_g3449.t1 [Chlamydomonas eustigma]|eukprot:GAX76006.1 hypothetical protein CEUSTIGMA_g3449.t1 [Chlamydomonas eustigma]